MSNNFAVRLLPIRFSRLNHHRFPVRIPFMNIPKLGKLEEIKNLREVWTHEAREFTTWLAQEENMALLGEALDIDIAVEEQEASVGDFRADIVATEAGSGRRIVIENQLEDTNHDHLGKIITYASGRDAEIIVWVVRRAREEHRSAIEWLNNHTDENIGFFLCEVKLYRIGDSAIAPKFEVVEKPNGWIKEQRRTETTSTTGQLYLDFWTEFKEVAQENAEFSKVFRLGTPPNRRDCHLYLGMSTCYLVPCISTMKKYVQIMVYVDGNRELYERLKSHSKEIDREMEEALLWYEMSRDGKAALVLPGADPTDEERWQEYFAWLMEKALRLRAAVLACVK